MKRLVYICDWLPPDFGAVGQYSMLFSHQRAAAGEDVVLAGLSSKADSEEKKTVGRGRLTTLRLAAPAYDRADLRARALWTARTNLRLLWRLRHALRRADEILFTGSPPFMVQFLVPLNVLAGKRLTYRITDFHPECLMAELPRTPLLLRAFYWLTVKLRQRVHGFEVLGEDQRHRLEEIGIPSHRIVLKRDPSPVEIDPDLEPLPPPASLADRVLLLYSGNFGVAHEHETFVEGYRRHHLRGSGRVGLWLNATGAKADQVAATLERENLPLHRGYPVPLEELPRLLVTPAAHLITLRDEFVGYVLPSKVYGCVASGRGVLYVGSERSDIHLICSQRLRPSAYQRAAVGDPNAVAEALEAIAEGQSSTALTRR